MRIEFNAEQDRLLLFVTTDDGAEVRLWFTRRCVRHFWSALVRMAEFKPEVRLQASPEARSAVLQFQHEKALQAVKFTENAPPAAPAAAPRIQPLGAEPVLVTRIQCRRESDGRTLLALLPSEGQGAHLTLGDNLLHGLMKLVQQGVEKAEWDMVLQLPQAPALEDVPVASRVLN